MLDTIIFSGVAYSRDNHPLVYAALCAERDGILRLVTKTWYCRLN